MNEEKGLGMNSDYDNETDTFNGMKGKEVRIRSTLTFTLFHNEVR